MTKIRRVFSIIFHLKYGALCLQLIEFSCGDRENMQFILSSSSNRKYEFKPLFMVRPWNNGTCCMSYYVLISIVFNQLIYCWRVSRSFVVWLIQWDTLWGHAHIQVPYPLVLCSHFMYCKYKIYVISQPSLPCYTVRSRYIVVYFLQISHERHHMLVFSEFLVWLRFYPRIYCVVWSIALYCTAVYHEFIVST